MPINKIIDIKLVYCSSAFQATDASHLFFVGLRISFEVACSCSENVEHSAGLLKPCDVWCICTCSEAVKHCIPVTFSWRQNYISRIDVGKNSHWWTPFWALHVFTFKMWVIVIVNLKIRNIRAHLKYNGNRMADAK